MYPLIRKISHHIKLLKLAVSILSVGVSLIFSINQVSAQSCQPNFSYLAVQTCVKCGATCCNSGLIQHNTVPCGYLNGQCIASTPGSDGCNGLTPDTFGNCGVPRSGIRTCYGQPPTCPAGEQLCNEGCIQGQCRPNTKTCAQWATEQCAPNTGGGGSCGSCSDYCAGADQCSSQGGTQVGNRCSGGSCSPGTSPCLICSAGPAPGDPDPPTCSATIGSGGVYPFIDLPNTATVGQAAQVWGQYASVNGLYTILNAINGNPRDDWHDNKMYSSNPSVITVSQDEVDPWHPTFGPLFNWRANAPGTATITYYVYGKPCPACAFKLACQTSKQITVAPNCFPNCASGLCGQSDGCGGTCPNTDAGTPNSPTITYPTNNSSVSPVGGTVTITWNNSGSSITDRYNIEIYPQGSSCSGGLPGTFCGTVTGTSYNLIVPSTEDRWTFRVRAQNISCGTTQSAFSTVNFTIASAITGNFYLDNNGSCSVTGSTPLVNIGGGTVSVRDRNGNTVAGTLVNGNTGYTATVPFWPTLGNNIVTVQPGVNPVSGQQLRCACNANGTDLTTCVRSGINSPQGNVHFFLTDRMPVDAWYQVINGSIYAAVTGGTGIKSYIPTNCTTPGCVPFVLRQNAAGAADSAGIAATGGSAIDTNAAAGNNRAQLTQRTDTTTSAIGTTMVKKEDYGYFARLYDIISTDSTTYDDFDGSPGRSAAGNAAKPLLPPRSGKKAYITSGDLTISRPWIVGPTEKIVIFVPGNLTISDPTSIRTLLTVAPGGFLGFIVQGNITIDSNVGYPAPYLQTTPNIEGLFLANGSINTPTAGGLADLRLVGAGNFVGWGGINMQRSLGLVSGFSETTPAELFISRPDFVKNIPIEMTSSSSNWQEIN